MSNRPPPDPMPVVTYQAVAKRLQKAANRRELDRVSFLIQFVPGSSDRDHLARIFKERADSFKAS